MEIKEVLNAIFAATVRPQTIQRDNNGKLAISALNFIQSNLRNCLAFYDELGTISIVRYNTENYWMSRIKSNHANCNRSIAIITNSTSQLINLTNITGASIPQKLYAGFNEIQNLLNNATEVSQSITESISRIRNSTSFLTPDVLNEFIDLETVNQMRNFLNRTVKIYNEILQTVNDAARLTFAYGSIYDMLYTASYNGEKAKNNSLLNFMNNFKSHQTNFLRNIDSYNAALYKSFNSFIQNVQNLYADDIVRPVFENDQLPIIYEYMKIISYYVYNQQQMNTTFENHRDAIVGIYSEYISNEPTLRFTDYIEVIMNLLRNSYLRNYGTRIDTLVSEAQREISTFTNGYTFCLDERTANFKIFMPGVSSWFANIRDVINSVIRELSNCLSSVRTIEARKYTQKCLQIVIL